MRKASNRIPPTEIASPIRPGWKSNGGETNAKRVNNLAASLATVAAVLAHACAAAAAEVPAVKTRAGLVQGARSQDVEVFKGIPYAQPPVGPLRWEVPQALGAWSGIRAADKFGPDCMQDNPRAPDGSTPPSEDCLYVNVWRPDGGKVPLPVLVWIHGGAFTMGGASAPVFDGGVLARHGIVVVTLNYRLGRFGLFAHPALTAAGGGTLGNYGYMDQIAALKWVRENIMAFGGDPNRITLMGESAGGIAVLDLLASPEAKGLFTQAIVQSGGGRLTMGGRPLSRLQGAGETAEDTGLAFARAVGIDGDGRDALARLRALPATVLMNGLRGRNQKINGDIRSDDPRYASTYAGGPIIDGRIKRTRIDVALERGDGAKIPIMIGTTSGDISVNTGQSKDELFAEFGPDAAAARRAFDPDGARSLADLQAELTRDWQLVEPARFVAQQLSKAGRPAWLYRFSYVTDSQKARLNAVPHGGDVAFFFGNLAARTTGDLTDRDRRMAALATAAIANFVRKGDPNGPGLGAWRPFSQAPRALFEFGNNGETGMIPDASTAKLDLVERMPHRAIHEP